MIWPDYLWHPNIYSAKAHFPHFSRYGTFPLFSPGGRRPPRRLRPRLRPGRGRGVPRRRRRRRGPPRPLPDLVVDLLEGAQGGELLRGEVVAGGSCGMEHSTEFVGLILSNWQEFDTTLLCSNMYRMYLQNVICATREFQREFDDVWSCLCHFLRPASILLINLKHIFLFRIAWACNRNIRRKFKLRRFFYLPKSSSLWNNQMTQKTRLVNAG